MSAPLEGIRVVEVAMWGFVPSAGALLAEWGAEVIKVEHARTGDPQRGLRRMGEHSVTDPNPAWEHPNRGKRSIGIDIAQPAGRALLGDLVREADVFLTSFLPDARRRLGIEVEDIRADNPEVIYARGSALGSQGAESEAGGYDMTAFWARSSTAVAATPRDVDGVVQPPAPAYGDTISGTNLAGGIAAALVKRMRTGEPSVVDVSLLGSGVWAMGLGLGVSLQTGNPLLGLPSGTTSAAHNPLVGTYRTADGRFVSLVMLQPDRYWSDLCRHIGHPDLADDPRFATSEALAANGAEAVELVRAAIAAQPLAHWTTAFRTLSGPWAPVQDSVQVLHDPQVRENHLIAPVVDEEGQPLGYELATGPVRFDLQVPVVHRAPEFAEHTELILVERGVSWERIAELKEHGTIT